MLVSTARHLRPLRLPDPDPDSDRRRRPDRHASTQSVALQRLCAGVVLLLAWQGVAAYGLDAYYISSPWAVARQIVVWIASGYIWPHLLSTITTTLLGFSLAALAGTAGAILLGSSVFADRSVAPLIFLAYSMPKVVFAPILVMWVGIGQPPAIILAFVTAFFMVFFNIQAGMRSVSSAYLNQAAIFGASAWTTTVKFRIPAAAPFIAAGLQQGLIYAFHGAIIGEMTSSNSGIGYVAVFAATGMDSTAVIAALCVAGVFSYLLVAGLEHTLGRFARHPSTGGGSAATVTSGAQA